LFSWLLFSSSDLTKVTCSPLKRPLKAKVSPEEYQLLQDLRQRSPAQNPPKVSMTLGERVADRFAEIMGSWRFIIIQSILLAIWVTFNIVAFVNHWDPYPFILLNLMLSFQAAYAAPIIMMSQNRQSVIDRRDAKHDYEINLKSELEIELLHDKMNLLRESEIVALTEMLTHQQQQLERIENLLSQRHSQ
jgi:uncharacterized membrane protein